MSETLVSGLIQLAISLGGAGLLVQILLLRQNRRKIAGEASSSEANAASTLSGAAVRMVENEQRARNEAEARGDRAEVRIEELNARLEERIAEFSARLEERNRIVERQRWQIYHRDMRVAVLINALRQTGVEIPPEPDYADADPHLSAPDVPATGPVPLAIEPPPHPPVFPGSVDEPVD